MASIWIVCISYLATLMAVWRYFIMVLICIFLMAVGEYHIRFLFTTWISFIGNKFVQVLCSFWSFFFFFFHCGVYDVNVGMWSLSDVLCGIPQSKLQLVFSFLTLHRAQFVIWWGLFCYFMGCVFLRSCLRNPKISFCVS